LAEQKRSLTIEDIIDVLQKKWYWVTIPFFFFVLLGAWLYVVLPREYEASTLILVQPQEIPAAYVVAIVSSGLEERVRTLSQEVMSRSNLEKIITEMDLFQKERAQGIPLDIIVASLRRRITVSVTGGGEGRVSSFRITYRGREPQNVADVANRLASLFIEGNLKLRARQASETTVFLERQLGDLKLLLEGYEKKVEEFRNAHMGELPEQLASNTATLTNLQNNLEMIQRSLTDARNRKLLIQGQLSQMESAQPGMSTSQRSQRLAELRARLEEMRAHYTREHPELKRLEEQIHELEKQPRDAAQAIADPRIFDLRNQLRAVTTEIAGLENDAARIKVRIDNYQQRVEMAPKREQEAAAITRDYEITRANYQRLLDRLYEAKRAENMEKRQQGEQFRILDLAQPSQTPVSPNLPRIALVFIALGLGSGTGILLLLEFFDNTVKGMTQLVEWSGNIPCITAVPLALTEDDKLRLRLKTVLIMIANLVIMVVGLSGVIVSKLINLSIDLPFNLPF
jgi:polysaccharide chain length determinant protein (PEP-CTERM system associated)